jgi:MOSC domain-containing protein YiiM
MTPYPSQLTNDGVVESVNAGAARTVEWRGQLVRSGIWKTPVTGRVLVQGVNVDGDDQADRTVHGGIDKAVYAYGAEDYDWWAQQLGYELGPGTFGENLTVRGVSITDAVIGGRWRIGAVLLEVSQPRFPCYKLGIRMNNAGFLRRFANAGRPGTYLRIVERGELAAGDSIEVVQQPAHGLTVGDVARIYLRDHKRACRLLDAPELPTSCHDWARRREKKHA